MLRSKLLHPNTFHHEQQYENSFDELLLNYQSTSWQVYESISICFKCRIGFPCKDIGADDMKLFGALEAGGTKMVCAIGDENGRIIERISIPTGSPADTMPQMVKFFKHKDIVALGIGCFGPLDLDKQSSTYGYITSTPKISWQNYPIVSEFEKALGIPVSFDTDVNVAALGEATWGCTQDVENSIYITVGTGVGVGVIIDGKPYHGMVHPEAGHILLNRHHHDPLTRSTCPFHRNCLEGLSAGPSIEERWGKNGIELGDRKEVWELEAYYLGQAIANYIMILSPQRIVIGGGVMHQTCLLPLIRQEVARQLNSYIRSKGLEDLEHYIVGASLNDNQGVMGAIKLAIDTYTSKNKQSKKMLKMRPVFLNKIWGGNQLNRVFNYALPSDHTGECWAISSHQNGDCIVEGMDATLSHLWKQQPELFGNLPGDTFPLLVKIIDAHDDLSVQVHPDDKYAYVHENGSLGKTECWYVLDCDPDATIIIGHNAASKEEMAQMVKNEQWNDLLREIPVHKGDFFQIDPGCLHAIKGGTLILETQQSSDLTYRFYDYNRLENGKPRKLHIEQSLDVTITPFSEPHLQREVHTQGDATITHLVTCPYYSVYHAKLAGKTQWYWDKPFVNMSIISGDGYIDGDYVRKGDHFIIPANYGEMTAYGNLELIYSFV